MISPPASPETRIVSSINKNDLKGLSRRSVLLVLPKVGAPAEPTLTGLPEGFPTCVHRRRPLQDTSEIWKIGKNLAFRVNM